MTKSIFRCHDHPAGRVDEMDSGVRRGPFPEFFPAVTAGSYPGSERPDAHSIAQQAPGAAH